MRTVFQDRWAAGQQLAQEVRRRSGLWRDDSSPPLILALPRGGVPVARTVAEELGAPWDILLVKKLASPWQPEYALGALCEDGAPYWNGGIDRASLLGLSPKERESLVNEGRQNLRSRAAQWRRGAEAPNVEGRTVVVVDDGLATGTTMRAAIEYLKIQKPLKIVVAVPVAPAHTVKELEAVADEVISLKTPPNFQAVGEWYRDFSQVSEAAVVDALASRIDLNSQAD